MTLREWADKSGYKKCYIANNILFISYPSMFRVMQTGKASKVIADKIYKATGGKVDYREPV